MRALLSVADREGVAAFARELVSLQVELFATDGTRDHLAVEGTAARLVSDLTSFPSLLGGQVKTLHPAVYAGILARRDRPDQLAELAEQGIGTIDLVAVNVRPFAPQVGGSEHRRGSAHWPTACEAGGSSGWTRNRIACTASRRRSSCRQSPSNRRPRALPPPREAPALPFEIQSDA